MFQQTAVLTAVLALLMSPNFSAAKSLPKSAEAAAEGTTVSETKLQIISTTRERLEANFFSPTISIHILSQVHSNGELVQLSITTMDGETIFAVDRPIDSSQSLLTLAGSEFLVVNETLGGGESKITEYAVPEAYSLQVKNAMKRHMLSKPLLRYLDSENVNSSGRNAIESLLVRPEVQLIATAAVALGNNGLHGKENPPAMAFYATALRFSAVLNEHDPDMSDSEAVQRNKRWWWWSSTTYCSNSDSNCSTGTCPIGPNCSGLCGPGCTCWWFVCFDCCYNIGCYLHDVYGCPDGTDSLQCWLTAPTGLICS